MKHENILKCFHWVDHKIKRHCPGVTYIDGRHLICSEYATGHGKKKKPIYFKFTKQCPAGGFYLSSGVVMENGKFVK